jgi:hypothetical protein
VSVEVVGNRSQPVIDPVVDADDSTSDICEHIPQHGPDLLRGIRVVSFPDHHRHEARLALGHPAVLVLVVPLGEASCLAQFTGSFAHIPSVAHCAGANT